MEAPSYLEAYYQYNGSSSATGHVELSDESPSAQSCYVGSLVANGTNTTLSPGGYQAALKSVTVSSVWNSNWWEGPSSGPWSNWGNVCAVH
jgi:hypothetical protein